MYHFFLYSDKKTLKKKQRLEKSVEATTHLGTVSENLVKIKQDYYERKLKLKEKEIENTQKYYSDSLAVQNKLTDVLNNILMHITKKDI